MGRIVYMILIFLVALVHLFLWLDFFYYKYDIRRIFRRVIDVFTE